MPTDCWTKGGLDHPEDLFQQFLTKVGHMVLDAKKTPVMWDEALLSAHRVLADVNNSYSGAEKPRPVGAAAVAPPKGTIIQVWRPWATPDRDPVKATVRAGYRVIYSPDTPWYLDQPTKWDGGMYNSEPVSPGLTEREANLIIGGEGAMWGETVDSSDWQATVWPRMAALAERLWSAKNVNNITTAEPRLRKWRCLMLFNGVFAEPLGGSGRQAPEGPGSCFQVSTPAATGEILSEAPFLALRGGIDVSRRESGVMPDEEVFE